MTFSEDISVRSYVVVGGEREAHHLTAVSAFAEKLEGSALLGVESASDPRDLVVDFPKEGALSLWGGTLRHRLASSLIFWKRRLAVGS